MANLKSLVVEMIEMPAWQREIIYNWLNKAKERGFKRLKELPSGNRLREMVKRRETRRENINRTPD